jgi:ribose transport system substrate-binding protein
MRMNSRSRFSSRLGMVVALAFVTAVLTSCSSSTKSDSPKPSSGGSAALPANAPPNGAAKIVNGVLGTKKARAVFITSGDPTTNQWIYSMEKGFESAGVDYKWSSAKFSNQVLAQKLETYINEKPDLLIVHNSDLSALSRLLTRAQQAGIYVIVLNLASNVQTDAFIGPNWADVGKLLAERMAKDCSAKDKKKVAIITGFGADANSVLISEAMQSVFKEKGLEVVANQPGQFDPDKARAISSTILQQHPDLCAFGGTWDHMSLGIANAVKQAGKSGSVGVYTADSSVNACDAIKAGTLTAAVNYGIADMGPAAVATGKYLLLSGLKAGEARTALYTRLFVVDKKNANEASACYSGEVL